MSGCVHRFFEDLTTGRHSYFCSICGEQFTEEQLIDAMDDQAEMMANGLGLMP
jgi:hypothetical protein